MDEVHQDSNISCSKNRFSFFFLLLELNFVFTSFDAGNDPSTGK
jgi:hypothetical protein